MFSKKLMLALLVGVLSAPAWAQTRIAMVNPSRIFADMQETKDLKDKLEAERQRLVATEKEKRDEIQSLQQSRDQFKPDHPQFDEINKKLRKAAIDFKSWGELTKLDAELNQKRQMRTLFEKIQRAVGEVAQRDGLDLVIADNQPEIPENMDQITFDQLRQIINQRNLMFASKKADISEQVLAVLDAQYRGAAPNRPAAATPGGAVPAASQNRPTGAR